MFFHPLKRYPGPKLWAASMLPWGFSFMSGNWHHKIMELHAKYGHIVRIGPNELSYDVPEAWEDIYGHPKHRKENPKPIWYLNPKRKELVGAEEKDHTRMRRLLATGFTNTAMLDQEPMIKENVDLLLKRLREITANGKIGIDIFEWLSYCTFDIIGDLTFGESFGCLSKSQLHPWLVSAFANIKLIHLLVLSTRIPFFLVFIPVLETWRLWRTARYFEKTIQRVVDKRLAQDDEQRFNFLQLMKTKKGALVSPLALRWDEAFSRCTAQKRD